MAGLGITKITQNPVTHNLRHGKSSIGTWLSLGSTAAAESLAHAGWDWLLVDMEHSLAGFETMVECFRAAQLGGSVPMARRALDRHGVDPAHIGCGRTGHSSADGQLGGRR